ncbi:hypothetical protein AB9P05_03855 [Roseivirga sp. BDSF3-8]|uniref:hypothetical protein n=1 Tax=Roseivirga sp. BDSF3-8 TaxID=3241598 RepID=UPI00353182A2
MKKKITFENLEITHISKSVSKIKGGVASPSSDECSACGQPQPCLCGRVQAIQ